MKRLTDKVCLITGGASGLGRGIAQRFTEEGARTIISDIDREAVEKTARELGVTPLVQDVTSESEWERSIAEVISRHSRLDVLVNNAGIFTNCPVEDTPLEDWRRVLDVNLTGVFLGCKHGIRAMKSHADGPSGSIINLSSVVGLRGQLGGSAYSASKGGVRLLTKTVAIENARRRHPVQLDPSGNHRHTHHGSDLRRRRGPRCDARGDR